MVGWWGVLVSVPATAHLASLNGLHGEMSVNRSVFFTALCVNLDPDSVSVQFFWPIFK